MDPTKQNKDGSFTPMYELWMDMLLKCHEPRYPGYLNKEHPLPEATHPFVNPSFSQEDRDNMKKFLASKLS